MYSAPAPTRVIAFVFINCSIYLSSFKGMVSDDLLRNTIWGLIQVYNFYLRSVLYVAAKAHEKSQSHLRILTISKNPW